MTTSNDPTSCGAARGKRVVPQPPADVFERSYISKGESCEGTTYGMFPLHVIWQRWFGKLRDSCGSRSLGETPEGANATEEAPQLAAESE
ncbi:hypothetical protein N780_04725 [Pontibacillus chungwhensis BH030062]|uniref:Uncharacterized protein n=1 Tax=Pontibacillus chungwhensis BH030062 TaxID=1385513 RepID=A0A0A2UUU2_9BACI|nr:hypothetical protein N780_04725 [Pontibacillus chungwhensis BH030062]